MNNNDNRAFTLVELIIVIVVIGILATISLVVYSGLQNRAYDSAVKNDLSNAAKQLEIAKATLGHYPANSTEFASGFRLNKDSYATTTNNALYCLNTATDEYAVGVISRSNKAFIVTSGGIQEGVTSVTPETTCQAVGTAWSSPPVNAPRAALHGFNPSGTAPSYNAGWNAGWAWTK